MDRYDAATGFVLAAHPRPQPQYTYPRMLSLESVKFSAVLGGFIGAGGVFVSAALNRVPLVAVRQQAFQAGSFMGVILAVGTLVR